MVRLDEQLLEKAKGASWSAVRQVGEHQIFERPGWHLIISPGKVHLLTFSEFGGSIEIPCVSKIEPEAIRTMLSLSPEKWSDKTRHYFYANALDKRRTVSLLKHTHLELLNTHPELQERILAGEARWPMRRILTVEETERKRVEEQRRKESEAYYETPEGQYEKKFFSVARMLGFKHEPEDLDWLYQALHGKAGEYRLVSTVGGVQKDGWMSGGKVIDRFDSALMDKTATHIVHVPTDQTVIQIRYTPDHEAVMIPASDMVVHKYWMHPEFRAACEDLYSRLKPAFETRLKELGKRWGVKG